MLPGPTDELCWNVPKLAGKTRARSDGRLCRGAWRRRGGHGRRVRGILRRVGANRLALVILLGCQ